MTSPDEQPAIRVEVRAAADLTVAELAHIHEVEERLEWGAPPDVQWGHPQWHVLVWQGDTLVGHAGLVRRTITVDGQSVEAGGLSGVWSLESERGQGHAKRAVVMAVAYACRDLAIANMLLLCREHVAAFYQRLGWERVEAPVTFDQPAGLYRWPALAMTLSCDGTQFPAGAIDLCGLPW